MAKMTEETAAPTWNRLWVSALPGTTLSVSRLSAIPPASRAQKAAVKTTAPSSLARIALTLA